MKLGAEGIDTSIAAFKVLDYPNFKVFVPAHSLTLEQSYSLVFMLYQLREDMIVEKTINRLQGEKNPTAVKSLLRVLWYAATPAADEIIAKFAKDTTTSDDVRKFAVELQNDTEQIAGLPLFEIEKLRKQLAFSKAIRKAAPVLSAHKKGEPMSKEEIELMKLFLRALFDSDEDILTDIAKNRDGTVPKEISDYAEGLLKGDKSLSHATPVGPPEDNITDLKNLRQTVLSALNDEVLYDFNAIAALIRWHQAKRAGQKAGQANAQPDVGADR